MNSDINLDSIQKQYLKYFNKYRRILPKFIISDSKLSNWCFNKAYSKLNNK